MRFEKLNITDKEMLRVANNIQEYICDDFNEEDVSVGLYAVNKLDFELMQEIFLNFNGGVYVCGYNDTNADLLVEKKYHIRVELVEYDYGNGDGDARWEIVHIDKITEREKIVELFLRG